MASTIFITIMFSLLRRRMTETVVATDAIRSSVIVPLYIYPLTPQTWEPLHVA